MGCERQCLTGSGVYWKLLEELRIRRKAGKSTLELNDRLYTRKSERRLLKAGLIDLNASKDSIRALHVNKRPERIVPK
jgi:hypothetical protein